MGLSLEILESKSKKWLLDGWSLDAFGSKKSIGLGISKDIYKNDLIEIDAGVFITRKAAEFFNKNFPTDVRIGLSGSFRF